MITADAITDEMIETLLDVSAAQENFDLFEACESAQKMIIQPNLLRAARQVCADAWNAREANYDGPPDGEAWSGGFAENH